MHDAAAATEVVCDASRKLVANAMMRCIANNRQQTPRGCGACAAICVVLLLSVLETDERNESDESWNTRKSVSPVSDLGWLREVFPLLAPSN